MKHKVVYGAAVSLSGVWGPKKMTLSDHEYFGQRHYYDKTGNLSVERLGEHHKDGIITFASPDRAKTALWVKGVKASMEMLKRWCQ